MDRARWMAAALAAAATVGSARAEAAGAWISDKPLTPIEQRIAIAAGPARTTVWTSLRFEAAGGKAAIVVPAPEGAALDLSSDAWLSALDAATAPRILPPAGLDAVCVGAPPAADPFQIAGHVDHVPGLAPAEIAVLADAPAVASWAAVNDLALAPALSAKLAASGAARFLALRFDAPAGAAVTPTVRLVLPGVAPQIPLALAQAGQHDLPVTAWIIGPGRASLEGAVEVATAPLTWFSAAVKSDYEDRRDDALAHDPARFLVEAAGHDLLTTATPIDGTPSVIDAAIAAYFDRAAAAGDSPLDPAACTAAAIAALSGTAPVAASCPRADIEPAPACLESPEPDTTAPDLLRCGPVADDLAVALSGLVPAETWITRLSLLIPAGNDGFPLAVDLGSGAAQSPIVASILYDTKGCAFPPSGNSSSSSSGDWFNDDYGGDDGLYDYGYGGAGGEGGAYDDESSASSGGESCSCDGDGVAAGLEACAAVLEGVGAIADACSVSAPRRHPPRFSALLLAALAVLVPLRRRLRPRR